MIATLSLLPCFGLGIGSQMAACPRTALAPQQVAEMPALSLHGVDLLALMLILRHTWPNVQSELNS